MVSIRQVKAARALLGWYQEDLSRESGVSKPTIARLETEDGELGGYAGTREKIINALESAGVIFVDANGDGPGVKLKKKLQPHPVDFGAPRPKPVNTRPKARSRRRGPA